jgi:hypothetical protein
VELYLHPPKSSLLCLSLSTETTLSFTVGGSSACSTKRPVTPLLLSRTPLSWYGRGLDGWAEQALDEVNGLCFSSVFSFSRDRKHNSGSCYPEMLIKTCRVFINQLQLDGIMDDLLNLAN